MPFTFSPHHLDEACRSGAGKENGVPILPCLERGIAKRPVRNMKEDTPRGLPRSATPHSASYFEIGDFSQSGNTLSRIAPPPRPHFHADAMQRSNYSLSNSGGVSRKNYPLHMFSRGKIRKSYLAWSSVPQHRLKRHIRRRGSGQAGEIGRPEFIGEERAVVAENAFRRAELFGCRDRE